MFKKVNHNMLRKKRHLRVRKKVFGTTGRPRLNVYRSLKHIYAQVIDDTKGVTLASASSLSLELKAGRQKKNNKETAFLVGRLIAQKAREKGLNKVVFDRGGYIFHGRIKALADAAREGGLEF
ncbi:MAG TPA: 50S ribosomal protein L18 [Desulfotomaculum sp.]|nr:50S ribosomal protein L18 [Desulfotomaculum sp.]HCJ79608.1 50S ribosomal protein L18 [Desulfotomaculum sp.]